MIQKKIIILLKKIIDLFHNKSAGVVIEFSLALPILILMFVASIEISNNIHVSQKNQSVATLTANLIGDLYSLIDNNNTSQIEDVMKLSDKITKSFVDNTGTDVGIVVTILQKGAVSAGVGAIFVLHQEKMGSGDMVKSVFNFVPLNKDVDADYVDKNRIKNPELVQEYDPFIYGRKNQLIVVETRMRYKSPLLSEFSETILGANPVVSFKNSPVVPRINRFKQLPGGYNTFYYPFG